MKRADMVVGMEVAVGTPAYSTPGVLLSPDALPLMYYRETWSRNATYGVPPGTNTKTTCTVAVMRYGDEWTPQHVPLSQVRPWATYAMQKQTQDAERQQAKDEWVEYRTEFTNLAEQVGLPVTRSAWATTVDGVSIWSRDATFPLSTVEKLLEQNLATADLLSACERLLVNFHNALRGTPVRDATETIAEAEAAIAKASKEVRP